MVPQDDYDYIKNHTTTNLPSLIVDSDKEIFTNPPVDWEYEVDFYYFVQDINEWSADLEYKMIEEVKRNLTA